MRNFIIVFLGIIACSLVGLEVIVNYKNKIINSDESNSVVKTEYITLWRAKEDINKGDPVSVSSLEKLELPLDKAVLHGVKKDVEVDFSPSTLLGVSLREGDYLLTEYQVKIGDPGYIDLLVTEGMVLYPLTVRIPQIIRDYIRPGVHVDIFSVSSNRSNIVRDSDSPNVFQGTKVSIFMEHVKVLSVPDFIDSGKDNAKSIRSSSDNNEFSTVIIEISPDSIASLALAQRTTIIEIFRSQSYRKPAYAEVRDVIDNYTGIEELRGNNLQPKEVL